MPCFKAILGSFYPFQDPKKAMWFLMNHETWSLLLKWTGIGVIQGVFFNWPIPFSVPKKTAFSQWELLFHEFLHLRKPLVGSLAYFLFGTEQGRGQLKKTPCISESKHISFSFSKTGAVNMGWVEIYSAPFLVCLLQYPEHGSFSQVQLLHQNIPPQVSLFPLPCTINKECH